MSVENLQKRWDLEDRLQRARETYELCCELSAGVAADGVYLSELKFEIRHLEGLLDKHIRRSLGLETC